MTREHMAFRWWLGYSLPPCVVRMLEDLAEAGGRPVRFPGSPKAVQVHICLLRHHMNDEAIDTGPDGYNLTEVGLEECAEALDRFGAWACGRAAA